MSEKETKEMRIGKSFGREIKPLQKSKQFNYRYFLMSNIQMMDKLVGQWITKIHIYMDFVGFQLLAK